MQIETIDFSPLSTISFRFVLSILKIQIDFFPILQKLTEARYFSIEESTRPMSNVKWTIYAQNSKEMIVSNVKTMMEFIFTMEGVITAKQLIVNFNWMENV